MGALLSTWFPSEPYLYGPPNDNQDIQVNKLIQPAMWEPNGLLDGVHSVWPRYYHMGIL